MRPSPATLPGMPAPPERDLQAYVVGMLRDYLPDEMDGYWCASLTGMYMPTDHLRAEAKRQGRNPGDPDLHFVWPDGETSYIELKRDDAQRLRPEQKRWADRLGPDKFSRCQTWQEVRSVLTDRLTRYGLSWLTDTESFRRNAERDRLKTRQPKARNHHDTRRQSMGHPRKSRKTY